METEQDGSPMDAPSNMSPPLPLPKISLPSHVTPHLRALIYASSPGTTITNLTLSPPPLQTISLTQLPPYLPLHHPPSPKSPPSNIFLDTFPLTAHLTNDSIRFTTNLPNIRQELREEYSLPDSAVANTRLTILLKTGTAKHTHGLLTVSSGKYEPLVKPSNYNIIGAWARGDNVFLTAALLQLSRYLYRRHNRRLNNTAAIRKNIVLLRFSDNGIFITRGFVSVDGITKFVCEVPLRGGIGEFSKADERVIGRVRSRVGRQRSEDLVCDAGRRNREETEERNSQVVDVDRQTVSGQQQQQQEEFMVAKMREFNFNDVARSAPEDVVETQATDDDIINVGEESTQLSPEWRVQNVDPDTLANETCTTTTSSSEDEKEEAMLESLCKQYLNHSLEECIKRELSRLDAR